MVEPDQRDADAGRKIVFSYGFVRDSDMEAKVMLYDDTTLIRIQTRPFIDSVISYKCEPVC